MKCSITQNAKRYYTANQKNKKKDIGPKLCYETGRKEECPHQKLL